MSSNNSVLRNFKFQLILEKEEGKPLKVESSDK
jgi:hypothetical protein